MSGSSLTHRARGPRKQGEPPNHLYYVADWGGSGDLSLTDEMGDDYQAFMRRANAGFFDYLSALGSDGWKLVSYTRYAGEEGWPLGAYLFMREVE